jgi:O-antigen ligase
MPEHINALVYIVILATVVFAVAKAPACATAMRGVDFDRRRNLWFAITATAFLAHNFWVYILVTAALLVVTAPREPNRLAMYFLVLFAVPTIADEITGLGVIKQFFTIHYLRLLALAVLFPAFLILQKRPDTGRFGRSIPDKFIAAYIILQFLLMLNVSTFTNALRHGVFYSFIDIFLPYYVASRSLRSLGEFRDAMMAFVMAALVLGAIAAFEFARHRLLYYALPDALGIHWHMGKYLERGAFLRVSASTGHPIVLGYIMTIAIWFMLYLRKSVRNALAWCLGVALLIVGLIVPVARGPWMGAGAMLLVFIMTGPSAARGFAKLGLLGVIAVPALLAFPFGKELLDYLPFAGTAGSITEDSVAYRQRLAQIAIQVILQNPLFGAHDYIYSTAFQELKQGEGIIDIVNSYVAIGLSSGLVGLTLFSGFFFAVAVGIFRSMRALADRQGESYLLGRVLLSSLLGILVTIATVSSIEAIPAVYWSVAGLGVAYARMLAPAMASKAPRPSTVKPAIVGNFGYPAYGNSTT